jgi:hypothetical protein
MTMSIEVEMPSGLFEKETIGPLRGKCLQRGHWLRRCNETYPMAEEVEMVRIAYILPLDKLEDGLLFKEAPTKR